jgi:hypothetical protein
VYDEDKEGLFLPEFEVTSVRFIIPTLLSSDGFQVAVVFQLYLVLPRASVTNICWNRGCNGIQNEQSFNVGSVIIRGCKWNKTVSNKKCNNFP